MSGQRHRGEQGQVLVVAAVVMAFLLVPLAVYVIDSGLVESGYLQMGETLQAAAEDGASSLDAQAYRQSGGQRVQLDQVQAKQTANRSLRVSGLSGLENSDVEVNGNTVTVKAELKVQLLGVGSMTLTQQRSATFNYGG